MHAPELPRQASPTVTLGQSGVAGRDARAGQEREVEVRKRLLWLTVLAWGSLILAPTGQASNDPDCGGEWNHLWKRVGERPVTGISSVVLSSPFLTMGWSTTCMADALSYHSSAQEAYFAANHGAILMDVARGEGEALEVLPTLFGCPVAAASRLRATAQQNIEQILPDAQTTPGESLQAFRALLRADDTLGRACRYVS